jgi:hypothetical protein
MVMKNRKKNKFDKIIDRLENSLLAKIVVVIILCGAGLVFAELVFQDFDRPNPGPETGWVSDDPAEQ